MTEVVLALGSNLGDRLGNLRAAIALLEERGVQARRRSSVWETAPIPADQPAFLNAVIAGGTALSPQALLALVKTVEHILGRRPERRWGPRPIDIDILFYGTQAFEAADLTVPHPRIAERAFVLAPLSEVAHGSLPGIPSATAALAGLDTTGISRTGMSLERP